MRLLTRCDSCARQYDASGRQPGERFRCHCGALLAVPTGTPHSAAVVRCSACGGTRQRDETDCSFCGSTLTLHERDLHTLCPGCYARISDRARYCHHCGLAITASETVTSRTERPCPVCGPEHPLVHRKLSDQVAALECGTCAGLWIGTGTFEILVDRAREELRGERGPTARPADPSGRAWTQRGPMYRRCVQCDALMARRNFGKQSGVIVDSCPNHGLWFDAHELDAVLRWLAGGGELRVAKAEKQEAERAMQKAREFVPVAPAQTMVQPESPVDDLVAQGLRAFFSLLS